MCIAVLYANYLHVDLAVIIIDECMTRELIILQNKLFKRCQLKNSTLKIKLFGHFVKLLMTP